MEFGALFIFTENMLSMPLSTYKTHDIFLGHFIFYFQLLVV